MADKFRNYIDGEWLDPVSGRSFENRNPSDISEVLGVFPDSGPADVDQAVRAAQKALRSWKDTPAPERGEILFRVAQMLKDRADELARTISRESGKTVKSAHGEVRSGIDMAYYAGSEGRRWFGNTSHSGLRKRFAMTKRYPVGVVGIITSWNFPFAITCWKTFPALVCGNTVILKSEENTPETAVHFVKALEDAGLPKGVINLVHGAGSESGHALTVHNDVSMISFTGSSAVGKIIGQNCSARLAKISLELGGKNGVIVLEDADLDLAVDAVVCGSFSISGQRCTATSRVIVQDVVYDAFVEKLVAETSSLKLGPGSDDASDVTPLISRKQMERVLGWIEAARTAGGDIILGGDQVAGGEYDKGFYIAPTIITNISPDEEISKQEVFGPVLIVLKADSYDHAMRLHNSTDYGLSAAIFTKDVNRAFSFFDDAEAGVCYINAPTFGSEPHMPFGGVKDSGLGYREAGWAAIEAFSEVRTLYIDYSSQVQNVQFVDENND